MIDILFLSDQKQHENAYDDELRKLNVSSAWADEVKIALNELEHRLFGAILIDFDAAGYVGSDACAAMADANDTLPVVALVTKASEQSAIALIGSQLSDVVKMPAHPKLLAERIRLVAGLACLVDDLQMATRKASSLLPTSMTRMDASNTPTPPFIVRSNREEAFPSMEEIERKYTQYVLNCVDGNRSHAARILGLSRKTLWRKLRGQQ